MNLKRISTGVNWQKPCIDSGASRGGAWEANLPLFLDQTEARRAEKNFFKTAPPLPTPTPTPYLRVWMNPYLKIWICHW